MFESRKKKVGVKLFIRKVFITDEVTDLVPEWLSFVKGVVDSDDLPLNISRETLQKNSVVANMKGVIVKKVIELLTELSSGKYVEGPQEDKKKKDKEGDEDSEESADDDNEEKALKLWKTFYEQFAKNLKLGIHEDSANREKLASLMRFHSTKSSEEMTGLDQYLDRMKEHQKTIYYITGESRRHCETSPFLEALKSKDFEVIFMDQAIDEYALSTLREYKGKKLQCITKDGLDLEETEEEKKKREEDKAGYAKLVDFVKEVLGDKVENVKIGYRLTTTPCVLTTSEWGWSAQMQRIMKAQALRDDSMASVMCGKATLEVNPNSKLVRTLKRMLDDDPDNQTLRSSVTLLYETAQISSGFSLEDTSSYVLRIYSMMAFGLAGEEEPTMPDLTGGEECHKAAVGACCEHPEDCAGDNLEDID
jgi:molecular chaperone HtpG